MKMQKKKSSKRHKHKQDVNQPKSGDKKKERTATELPDSVNGVWSLLMQLLRKYKNYNNIISSGVRCVTHSHVSFKCEMDCDTYKNSDKLVDIVKDLNEKRGLNTVRLGENCITFYITIDTNNPLFLWEDRSKLQAHELLNFSNFHKNIKGIKKLQTDLERSFSVIFDIIKYVKCNFRYESSNVSLSIDEPTPTSFWLVLTKFNKEIDLVHLSYIKNTLTDHVDILFNSYYKSIAFVIDFKKTITYTNIKRKRTYDDFMINSQLKKRKKSGDDDTDDNKNYITI